MVVDIFSLFLSSMNFRGCRYWKRDRKKKERERENQRGGFGKSRE